MSTQVFRYELKPETEIDEETFAKEGAHISIELPKGAEVLGFFMSSKGFIVGAAVDVDEPTTELRHFLIAGNGTNLPFESPLDARMAYIDTRKIPGGPTWHLFEVTTVNV